MDKDALSTATLESAIGAAFRTLFQQHIHSVFLDYEDRAEQTYRLQ
jgi:hypothetical protein